MKQIVSILLIFTVNILFLTHALLPHHHHNGIPHLSFSVEKHHAHQGEDGCCCPSETENSCDQDCAFDKDLDVIAPTDDENHIGLLCCSSHTPDPMLLQAVLFSLLYDFSLPDMEYRLRTVPPYLISYQNEYRSRTLGLRAPPCVDSRFEI